jgi:hypothetical protein
LPVNSISRPPLGAGTIEKMWNLRQNTLSTELLKPSNTIHQLDADGNKSIVVLGVRSANTKG